MKISILNKSGEKINDMARPDIFDVAVSDRALTHYINYLRAALRAPIANTKDRGQVSGGGRKPWKQKGTGNARVGSIRSPLWIGGGVTFGPSNERNYRLRLNQIERKNAILGILNRLAEAGRMIIVDQLSFVSPKTGEAAAILNSLKTEGKVSVIVGAKDENAILSFRNIAGANVMVPGRLNMIQVLSSDRVVLTSSAVQELSSIYGIQAAKTVKTDSKEASE